MTREELIGHVVSANWEWSEGESEGGAGVFIRWPECPEGGEVVHVADAILGDLEWATVRRFVLGGRHVSHMTRIVGYYSRVENWNQSKLGELADRQKGLYGMESKPVGECGEGCASGDG